MLNVQSLAGAEYFQVILDLYLIVMLAYHKAANISAEVGFLICQKTNSTPADSSCIACFRGVVSGGRWDTL
jgi:hypothetical protein